MLWLSIHLPRLPLEVFGCDPAAHPLAVAEGQHILMAGPAAMDQGVQVGMRIAAAQGLCPNLVIRSRLPKTEHRLLRRLAAWSIQFSASVALDTPDTVLLEIGGSLRYFGTLESLEKQIRHGLQALGYSYQLGIAPTPTAARLLSLAGEEHPVTRTGDLSRALGGLPITLLPLNERQLQALNGLGAESIADCLALPRAELARRLGKELVHGLDRAVGHAPDPRTPYFPPSHFRSGIELPAEVTCTDQLGFGLNRLIHELCGFLRGTGTGVQRLHITLAHLRHAPTAFALGTVTPSRDPGHLMSLLRERLERVQLAAPVIAMELEARRLQRLDAQPLHLLAEEKGKTHRDRATLLERLAARLGEPRIRGIGTHPEHRPERAWRYTSPGEKMTAEACHQRPLWLFPTPQGLPVQDNRPLWHGPLTLEQGPECIESGWWDGNDISRDYYVAVNPHGARLWVFRERREPRQWFLHGIFG